MIRVEIGPIFEGKVYHKNTKEYRLIDSLSRDVTYFCKRGNSCFKINITSAKPVNEDNRYCIIEIEHLLKKKHSLQLVICNEGPPILEGHFHLNLTKKSEENIQNCSICRKYFCDLDHFCFNTIDKPIIEIEDIWGKLKIHFWLFFRKYKYIKSDITCK